MNHTPPLYPEEPIGLYVTFNGHPTDDLLMHLECCFSEDDEDNEDEMEIGYCFERAEYQDHHALLYIKNNTLENISNVAAQLFETGSVLSVKIAMTDDCASQMLLKTKHFIVVQPFANDEEELDIYCEETRTTVDENRRDLSDCGLEIIGPLTDVELANEMFCLGAAFQRMEDQGSIGPFACLLLPEHFDIRDPDAHAKAHECINDYVDSLDDIGHTLQ